MTAKIVRAIIRDYLGCEDRIVLFGTQAETVLRAIKDHRLDLLRELKELEARDDSRIAQLFVDGILPKSITPREFLVTLRVLACLEAQ